MHIMATKTGRNDPCLCGSGKKYKRCCFEKDQKTESAALAAAAAARIATQAEFEDLVEWEDKFTDESNAVLELIRAGKLDQAEQAARDLLAKYPDVHDGHDRLGMIYQARGDQKQAAACYRQALKIVRAHPDDYDPYFESHYLELIAKLDPEITA
jgi:tetratricopeptide (TPR) repeat protein